MAAQRDEEGRTNYQIHMTTTYRADQLVFVDEAACNRATTKRGWAWAPIGEQARRHDVYIRGIKCVYISGIDERPYSGFFRYSVLPALSLSGVLHLDVLAGSYKARDFNSFIDGLLDNMNPFPGPNSVIVMDNASIHKSPELRPMIEQRYGSHLAHHHHWCSYSVISEVCGSSTCRLIPPTTTPSKKASQP